MDLVDFSSLLLQSAMFPSITSFCIVVMVTMQLVSSRLRANHVLDLQFRVAVAYSSLGMLVALGAFLGIDLAGSLSGSDNAVTPFALVLAFVGVACLQRRYVVASWLLLVLVSFEMRLTGVENFWFYLIDPIALCCAIAFLFLQRKRFSKLRIEKTILQRSALVVIAVFLGYAVYLSRIDPGAFRHAFVVEDGFVEWSTVVVLILTMVVCFRRVVVLHKERSFLFLFVTSLLGVFCFFGAGEEISWGQRLFGLESPAFFQDNNAQGEIGLHNIVIEIDGERLKLNKLIFGTGLAVAMLIYLFVATPLYKKNTRAQGFFNAIGAPMPQNYQVFGYLLIVAIVELLIDHSKRGEMIEFAGAMMFSLNVIYPDNAELFEPQR